MFVHPTQAIEIFGNVSMPFGTMAICDPSVKILRRSPTTRKVSFPILFERPLQQFCTTVQTVITVRTVAQNCCKGRSKKYRKWQFSGCCRRKPLNRLTLNLAWVITSGTPLCTPNGISIGSGAWPPRRGEMLMVCAAGGQTAGPILTSNVSKRVFLEILHSFVG